MLLQSCSHLQCSPTCTGVPPRTCFHCTLLLQSLRAENPPGCLLVSTTKFWQVTAAELTPELAVSAVDSGRSMFLLAGWMSVGPAGEGACLVWDQGWMDCWLLLSCWRLCTNAAALCRHIGTCQVMKMQRIALLMCCARCCNASECHADSADTTCNIADVVQSLAGKITQ